MLYVSFLQYVRRRTEIVQDSVSLIVANLAVVVTHIRRFLSNGGDIDHSRYDETTPSTGLAALSGIARHTGLGPKIGCAHFPLTSPQLCSGQGTNSSGNTEINKFAPSNINARACSPDLSDYQLAEEKTAWREQDVEATVPRSPTRVIITRDTIAFEAEIAH